MSYPHDPPFPAQEWDRRDRQSTADLYYWAGSDAKAVQWLNAGGVTVSERAFANWRRRHALEIANPDYATRGNPVDSALIPPAQAAMEAGLPRDELTLYLKRNPSTTIEALADRFDVSPKRARAALEELEASHVLVQRQGEGISLARDLPVTRDPHRIDFAQFSEVEYPLGFVADNHLGSKYERLDVLESLYDRFAAAGVRTVYQGGNILEGECRFNRFDIYVRGIEEQVGNLVAKWPQRDGITTEFVTGDDHEGWYVQREHINIGQKIEDEARRAGREDLVHLGYIERDLVYEQEGGQAIIRVIHAGGGSTYATSYTAQKYVESLQGGEKPQIVLVGHYHKFDYSYPREVHVIQGGCTQDQTPFLRKRKIQAHVGGVILWVRQNSLGVFTSVKVEWLPYYDRRFYQYNWDKPDVRRSVRGA